MNVGHLFNGELKPFPADTALAVAAVRHVIHTEGSCVIDNNAAEVESIQSVKNMMDILENEIIPRLRRLLFLGKVPRFLNL